MSRSLIPARIIASDICEDMGDSDETKFYRVLKKVGQAYKQLHTYISPELSVQSCILPADNQVELPCDFLFETKVGLLKNNCLVTLDLNRNLRPNNLRVKDSQIESDINGFFDGSIIPSSYMPFYNVFRGGSYVGELYGIGSGYHSNNWYNIKEGVLEISSLILGLDVEVVIEYKSDGVKDAYKLIPSEMELAITFLAKSLFYKDTQRGLSDGFMEDYKEQYQRLKRLYSFRPPDYLAWLFHSHDSPSPR